jgi:polysaccharide biosynthesis transport protein
MLDKQARRIPMLESARAGAEEAIGLREIVAFVRRRRTSIVVGIGIGLALGILYLLATPETYRAETSLLVDTRKLEIFGSGNVFEDASINTSTIESQVQVLLSGKLADTVVERLKLTEDPAFMNPPEGPVAAVRSAIRGVLSALVGGAQPPADAAAAADRQRRRAAALLARNLSVERVGLSYVIGVAYTSNDANEAARIANGVAEAFLDDLVTAASDEARRATTWLEGRIAELRTQADAPGQSPQEKSAVRATYDSMVARYTQMAQQESVPFAQARVITVAEPPTSSAGPKAGLILAGALFAGGILGLGLALGRDLLDRAVWSPRQLEALTGVACLGVLPSFNARGWAVRLRERRTRRKPDTAGRTFTPGAAYSMAITAPSSRFAETLRNVKLTAVDSVSGGGARVLGVISSMPNEGRTTVAVNLARLAASSGLNVLLVDGDLRNPMLSSSLVPPNAKGLVQASTGAAPPDDLIWSDHETPLRFLPAGAGQNFTNGDNVLASEVTAAIFAMLRQRYDMIVVDLPPVVPVIDVRAAAHLFDAFVYVVEWGSTSEAAIGAGIGSEGIEARTLGTVLNKVDLSRLGRYEPSSLMMRWSNKYLKSYRYIQ